MTKYNTNLASEFYVMATLYRLGLDAALTLGNKKAVDIFVHRDDDTTATIDVKGVVKRYDWPVDNVKPDEKSNHFIVLVCFNGKIAEPNTSPSVWVIPVRELKNFIIKYKTRSVVSRKVLHEKGEKYRDAWELLVGDEYESNK